MNLFEKQSRPFFAFGRILAHVGVFGLVLVLFVGYSHAQPTVDSLSEINLGLAQGNFDPNSLNVTNVSSIRWLSNDQLTILLNALANTPEISVDALPRNGTIGNFFSLEHPEWPPLPLDSSRSAVWVIGGGYLMADVGVDYDSLSPISLSSERQAGTSMTLDATLSPPVPGGGGDGTNTYESDGMTYSPPDYGTNLWIAQWNVTTNLVAGVASNTIPDVGYELQWTTNLLAANWTSLGFIYGSETTNWTALIPQSAALTNNGFFRLRSWQSSDGSGIPDWWETLYFGTNPVNPDAQDGIGDGYTIYQKYQMNVPPTTWITPLAPPGFAVFYNSYNGTVTVTWQPSQGNVTGYLVQRYDPTTSTRKRFTLPNNATSLVDTSPITTFVPEYGEPIYTINAIYSRGNSAYETLAMFNARTTVSAQIVLGSQGQNELLISGPVPPGTTALLLTRSDFDWDTSQYTEKTFSLPLSSLNNNSTVLPAAWFDGSSLTDAGEDWYVQTVAATGSVSDMTPADSLSWYQGVQQSPAPFYDGRQQMAQNAAFLLRAANIFSPLDYSPYQLSYAYAGLYDVTTINSPYSNGSLSPDAFRPFITVIPLKHVECQLVV